MRQALLISLLATVALIGCEVKLDDSEESAERDEAAEDCEDEELWYAVEECEGAWDELVEKVEEIEDECEEYAEEVYAALEELHAAYAEVKEGGVIGSDHVRHPLKPMSLRTRERLLQLARDLDILALKWGK